MKVNANTVLLPVLIRSNCYYVGLDYLDSGERSQILLSD